MWRNVICAHVLNVGVSPSSITNVNQDCLSYVRIFRLLTLVPPSFTYSYIFTLLVLRYLAVLLLGLRYVVICHPRALFYQCFTCSICDISFRKVWSGTSNSLRNSLCRAGFRRWSGLLSRFRVQLRRRPFRAPCSRRRSNVRLCRS